MQAAHRFRRLAAAALVAVGPAMAAAQSQLETGYYVLEETDCGQASNVDISLVHWSGINAVRTVCEFTSVAPAPGRTEVYDFVQTCTEIGAGGTVEVAGQIVIASAQAFELLVEGRSLRYRHCPQAGLPEPWRSVDLSDLPR